MMADLEPLTQALGYSFKQATLLQQALTHRSYSAQHNERLEFVGDGILNASIAYLLYETFPRHSEGELSRLRTSLVRQETLAEVAMQLQLGCYLWLGGGELKSGGKERPSILADALEALLGAIWFDGGFEKVHAVILRLFQPRIAQIDANATFKDCKTVLQEWLQARQYPPPDYVMLDQTGRSHDALFKVACQIPRLDINTSGQAGSRRTAEQRAAEAALALLQTTRLDPQGKS